MLYIFLILGAVAIICAVNILLLPFTGLAVYQNIILVTVLDTIFVIAIDGISAFAIRRLPKKWFSHESILSNVSKRECVFYQKLGVRKWREKIPELGLFTGFHKNKVEDPSNADYIQRYILEANYGAVIHFVSVPLGFLIIFLFPMKYALPIAVPVAVVNAVLNLLPAFILRYNIPKLQALLRRNLRKAVR